MKLSIVRLFKPLIHVRARACVCVRARAHVCVCVCTFVCICVHAFVCMDMCAFVCMDVYRVSSNLENLEYSENLVCLGGNLENSGNFSACL